jgi:tape measure domain-containing protein
MSDDSKTLELQIRIAAEDAARILSSLKGEIQSLAVEAKKLSDSDGKAIANTFQQAQSAAEKAAASMKLFGSSSSELRQVQAQLKNAAVELVTKGFDPQSEEVRKLIEEYKRLKKEADELDKANDRNVSSFGDLKSAMMSLAEVVALTKALSVIKDMGAFALQTADNFQTMKNQFGILLGDMEAGAGLFNEIKAFNDVTPFDLDTLTQATNVLIGAKVPLKDLQAQLTKFGDLSQGNSQRMTSYVNAFSQAAAKGKADMQVLNTYLHQGVPILDALAKNFGKTTAEIVEMSSKGEISFQDFSKALDDLTAAGGQYFGGMELASKSLAAMQEGLKEAVNSLAASFGEMLLPAATGITGMFTDLTNAINESPILKGILAAAVTAVTALMGVMAVRAAALTVKTWLAQAAQMGLNASLAVTNPLLWAGIAAAAAATAGYVMYASSQQKAARENENMAYQQRMLNDAMAEGANAAHQFYQAMQGIGLEGVLYHMQRLRTEIAALQGQGVSTRAQERDLRSAIERFQKLRDDFVKDFYEDSGNAKIMTLNARIRVATQYLNDPATTSEEDKAKLRKIIADAQGEINKIIVENGGHVQRSWKAWFGEITKIDPKLIVPQGIKTAGEVAAELYIEGLERSSDRVKATAEALGKNFDITGALRNQQGEIQKVLSDLFAIDIRDIDDPFILENKSVQSLIETYKQLGREAAIADHAKAIEELQKKIDDFGKSEAQLAYEAAIANGATAEQADKIRELTEELERLGESSDAIKDWQQVLSDSFTLALMDLENFSEKAAVIIGDLSAQMIELSASATLSGFEEFGRALGEGKNAAESMSQALASMAEQILNQLPMMFLQAGLQLIANGQWALGLGFVAAAGSTAIISGYVDGEKQEASKHAQGGVFDEYGRAARMFAAGGAFTNQIVSSPTYFAHGGGLGLMGEAGPEAIMPLTRMPNGDLGVQTAGGGANVVVNIINNSGAEVHQEETETPGGGRQIDITIGEMINRHIMSGKADRAMGGRFGMRAQGV